MCEIKDKKPVVLVLAGHDPCGGAGIQADIETMACNGCLAATVLTAMTTQNTSNFRKSIPVNPVDFKDQLQSLSEDIQFDACKIGLVTDPGLVPIIETILGPMNKTPVVIDPVIFAGCDNKTIADRTSVVLYGKLMPYTTVLTPNSMEARMLTGLQSLDEAASEILDRGCSSVLITGTHEQTDMVINKLYLPNERPIHFEWERLPGEYHGSGCTLASAIAAQLALGKTVTDAVTVAQEYTWQTLKHGISVGKKQIHPYRFYRFNQDTS